MTQYQKFTNCNDFVIRCDRNCSCATRDPLSISLVPFCTESLKLSDKLLINEVYVFIISLRFQCSRAIRSHIDWTIVEATNWWFVAFQLLDNCEFGYWINIINVCQEHPEALSPRVNKWWVCISRSRRDASLLIRVTKQLTYNVSDNCNSVVLLRNNGYSVVCVFNFKSLYISKNRKLNIRLCDFSLQIASTFTYQSL